MKWNVLANVLLAIGLLLALSSILTKFGVLNSPNFDTELHSIMLVLLWSIDRRLARLEA